jgi:hypothetical protein
MRIVLVLAIIVALVLGYGYYHAATHGRLHVNLIDRSVKPSSGNVRDADIRLLDSDGKLLATAKSGHQFGVVRLIHPDGGDCSAEECRASSSSAAREEWRKCFESLSTWLIRWAGGIRFVDVRFGNCDFKKVPATLHESREDWWLWWVPLPHVGGKPLTYFSVSFSVDGANCKAKTEPGTQAH